MKINPIGIQSYQQLTNRQNQSAQKLQDEKASLVTDNKVTIDPQQEDAGSRLAVKANSGSYADYLSPEEKNALDLLFSKFKNTERFGGSYQSEQSPVSKKQSLGNTIDIKV